MADDSIRIDIDVDTTGADKAARSISALEKQLEGLQEAVTALKSPGPHGGTVLDSLQLNSSKVKNLKDSATALKGIAEALSAVSKAADGLSGADLTGGVDKAVSAYRKFVSETKTMTALAKEQVSRLKDTASAMREVASASNAMADAENKAKKAQASLNQSQARKTEAQAGKLRAQAGLVNAENALPLQKQQGRDERALVKAKGNEAARLAEINALSRLQEAEQRTAAATAAAEAKREAAALAASARITAARESEAARTERAQYREDALTQRQAIRSGSSDYKASLRANEQAIEKARYAARDTAVYYGAVATALGGVITAAANAGAEQERAFADVRRTAQGTSKDLSDLQRAYTALSTTTTTSFKDLATIGTLGAQMNIPTKELEDFTAAVAKFSTVTGMGVEAATTAFGRFGQMMGGLNESTKGAGDGYAVLANQIADLGAKSVATEPEIANMAVSIAAQAKAAGLSQNETLALSSTLASLAIPKEWARGSLQRIFNTLNAAVAEGSDALKTYSSALGVTDTEFQRLWQNDPNKVLQGVLQSVADIGDKVQRAQAIKDLGFKNVRDVELISRMSQNLGLYVEQLKEAQEASKGTSFIDDSMGIIMDTLSAKVQAFQNALQNAGAAMNTGFLVPLKAVITIATGVVNAFAKLPAPIQAFVGALVAVNVARAGMVATKAAIVGMSATYLQMQNRVLQATGQTELSWGTVFRAVRQAQTGVSAYDQTLAANAGTANTAAAANQRLAASENAVAVAAGRAATAKAAQGASGAAGVAGAAGIAAQGARIAAGAEQAAGALSKVSSIGSGIMAMFGGPWGLAVTAGITVATTALSFFGDSFQSASEKAENFKSAAGGSSAILNALAQDTKEVGDGTQTSFAELNATIEQNGQTLQSNGEVLGYYMDKTGQVVQATHAQADAFGYSTLKIGEHTQALVLDAIRGSSSFKDMSKDTKQALAEMGFSYAEYVRIATTSESQGGGKAAADAYVDSYIQQIESRKAEAAEASQMQNPVGGDDPALAGLANQNASTAQYDEQAAALNQLKSSTEGVGGAMRDALNDAQLFSQGMDEAGDATEGAGNKADDADDKFTDMASAIRGMLDEMFSSTDAAAALDSALQQVYESMQENGTSMDPNSPEGQANIAAISNYFEKMGNAAAAGIEEMGLTGDEAYQYAQQSIQDTIDYLSAQGFDMSQFEQQRNTMAAIIAQPYQSGEVDHTATDNSLNQMVGNAAQAVSQAQGFLGKVQAIWNAISGYQAQIGNTKSKTGKGTFTLGKKPTLRTPTFSARNNGTSAFSGANFRAKPQRSSRGGGGGRGSRGGGDKSPSSRARKETKTAAEIFEDFINRLKSALDKALTKWWQSTTAHDNYRKSLNSLRKDVENTTKKIEDLRKENEHLNADLKKNEQELHDAEFFNAVARKYGDQERIRSTQTDIDTAKQDIAEKRNKISDNANEMSKLEAGKFALQGYTEAAIANREALRSLQSQMIGLIEAYAAAGHSTQEVEAYTQSLKQQFIDQVTQLGFNRSDVTYLAGAFDGLTRTIGQVPRDVRENVTDEGTVGKTQGDIDSIHGSPVTVPVNADTSPARRQIQDFFASVSAIVPYSPEKARYDKIFGFNNYNKGVTWRNKGGSIPGYAGGGLLPGRPPSNPGEDNLMGTNGRGLFQLRSGEFVISQPAVDMYGQGFMQSLNAGRVPVVNVSSTQASGGVVTLNPQQFNALVRAVSTTVALDGRAISNNLNRQNVGAGNRGVY